MGVDLFAEDDDTTEPIKFNSKTSYAKNYDTWRSKEEHQKLKDRYGKDADLSESSTDESEDDTGRGWDDEMEEGWLKTLAALKSGDDRLKNPNFSFYSKKEITVPSQKVSNQPKSKPMFLSDYDRTVLKEKGGMIDEDDLVKPVAGSYAHRQATLKNSFKKFLDSDEEQKDDDDGFLTVKKDSQETIDKKEAAYVKWLKGKESKGLSEETKKDLAPLKDIWMPKDAKVSEKDEFLRNYFLNALHKEATGMESEDDDEEEYRHVIAKHADLLEADDDFEDENDAFEKRFNFRHEEGHGDTIQSYARQQTDTLRKTTSARATSRKERAERKKEEKSKDIQRLAQYKQSEVRDQMARMKKIAGLDEIKIPDELLKGDYDPEKHADLMTSLFDQCYYDEDEDHLPEIDSADEYAEDLKGDSSKWDDWNPIDERDEGGDGVSLTKKEKKRLNKKKAKDKRRLKEEKEDASDSSSSGSSSDDDETREGQQEEIKTQGRRAWQRSQMRTSKLAAAIAKPKPVFDPKKYASWDEYLDEYFGDINCEDVIAGEIPCRFKWRRTEPMDWGLSTEEILAADERELNAWVSVKKTGQYRPKEIEEAEKAKYRAKATEEKKAKALPSVYQVIEEDETTNKKKKKKKDKEWTEPIQDGQAGVVDAPKEDKASKKKNKHKRRDDEADGKKLIAGKFSEERLLSYDINPKKFKYTHHKFTKNPSKKE